MQHVSGSVRRQMGENYLLGLYAPAQKMYMAVKVFLIAIGLVAKRKGVKGLRLRGDNLHSLFLEYAREMEFGRDLQMPVFGNKSLAVNYYLENPEFKDENGGQQFVPLLMHTTNPGVLDNQRDKEKILKVVEKLFDKILETQASK
jgi:hypothetical protein